MDYISAECVPYTIFFFFGIIWKVFLILSYCSWLWNFSQKNKEKSDSQLNSRSFFIQT